MQNNVTIVSVSDEHIPQIVQLEREIFSIPWSTESFISEKENECSHFTAAILDNAVVGFCILRSFYDEGEILNIAVSPDHRGKSIGHALIGEAIEYADSHGIEVIFLEVRRSNEPAISLYKKYNFEPIAIRKNYYDAPKEDAIIMRRTANTERNP